MPKACMSRQYGKAETETFPGAGRPASGPGRARAATPVAAIVAAIVIGAGE